MEEKDVIEIITTFISRQFPKDYACCGKRYHTLADYFKHTTQVDKPISYDAEDNDWKPKNPIGTMSISNCECGTSIALHSKGMRIATLWRLMHWAKNESRAEGKTMSDFLEDLRNKIEQSVFQNNNKKP